jgi:hypothetical protein
MSTILTITTNPQSWVGGAWPRDTMNNGLWRFSFTFTGSNSSFTEWGAFFARPTGGFWCATNGIIKMFDSSDNEVFSQACTWSAGQTLTFTVDVPNAQITIQGATTGNGTYTLGAGPYFTTGGLKAGGVDGVSGFACPGTFSNVDDGKTTLGALTATGTGTVTGGGGGDIFGTADITLGALTGSGAGTAAITGLLSGSLGTLTAAGTGTVAVTGSLSSTLGALTAAGTGTVTSGSPFDIVLRDNGPGTFDIALTSGASGIVGVADLAEVVGTSFDATALFGAVSASADLATATFTAFDAVAVGDIVGVADFAQATFTSFDATTPGGFALGDYGSARQLFGAAATSATVTLDTAVSGSTIILCTGGRLTDLANAPTDNKGNTYTALNATEEYADWPGYGIRMWQCIGATGGTNHQITQTMTIFDEVTITAVEILGASYIASSAIVERSDGTSVVSPSVSSVLDAHVIVFWSGDAPTGQTAVLTPDNGFSVIDSATLVDHPNGYVPIAIIHALKSPGTHTTTIGQTPTQGAIIGAVAVQEYLATAGTLNVTLGALTAVGTGTVAVQGSLNVTLGALTGSGAGTAAITGLLSGALGELTLVATGSVGVRTDADLATATLTAFDGTAAYGAVSAAADLATATLTAFDGTAAYGAVSAAADLATATLTAFDGTAAYGAVSAAADLATATLTAFDGTAAYGAVSAAADLATATLTAFDGTAAYGAVSAAADLATATLTAFDGGTNPALVGDADLATATLTAFDGAAAYGAVSAAADLATATLTAFDGTAAYGAVVVVAELSLGTFTAFDATATAGTLTNADLATATLTAFDSTAVPGASIALADLATALLLALDVVPSTIIDPINVYVTYTTPTTTTSYATASFTTQSTTPQVTVESLDTSLTVTNL